MEQWTTTRGDVPWILLKAAAAVGIAGAAEVALERTVATDAIR